jgi:hypothetical protein
MDLKNDAFFLYPADMRHDAYRGIERGLLCNILICSRLRIL